MFTERDAQKVFFLVNRGRLAIGGLNTIIRYNTAHPIVPERPLAPLSRSLVFRGPKEIVDVHRLYRFLSSKMKFQTQDVYVADVNEEERIVEWVFASYQGQAQVAKAILKNEYPNLILRYGEDPMALTFAGRTEAHLAVTPTVISPAVAKAVVNDDNKDGKSEIKDEIPDLLTFGSSSGATKGFPCLDPVVLG